MAVAQHHRGVAGADWWTGPASWRVGVAPVSRAAIRYSLPEGARENRPPSQIVHMSSIQYSGLLFVCFTRTTPVFIFFNRGFSPPILWFSPKKWFSTLILVVFPLCLSPVFFSS